MCQFLFELINAYLFFCQIKTLYNQIHIHRVYIHCFKYRIHISHAYNILTNIHFVLILHFCKYICRLIEYHSSQFFRRYIFIFEFQAKFARMLFSNTAIKSSVRYAVGSSRLENRFHHARFISSFFFSFFFFFHPWSPTIYKGILLCNCNCVIHGVFGVNIFYRQSRYTKIHSYCWLSTIENRR